MTPTNWLFCLTDCQKLKDIQFEMTLKNGDKQQISQQVGINKCVIFLLDGD